MLLGLSLITAQSEWPWEPRHGPAGGAGGCYPRASSTAAVVFPTALHGVRSRSKLIFCLCTAAPRPPRAQQPGLRGSRLRSGGRSAGPFPLSAAKLLEEEEALRFFGLELMLSGGMWLFLSCDSVSCHPFAKGAFSFW